MCLLCLLRFRKQDVERFASYAVRETATKLQRTHRCLFLRGCFLTRRSLPGLSGVTRPAAQASAERTTPRAEQDASFLRGFVRFKCVYARYYASRSKDCRGPGLYWPIGWPTGQGKVLERAAATPRRSCLIDGPRRAAHLAC